MIRQRTEKGGIGFGASVHSKDENAGITKLFGIVEPEDLIKFGLIPELIGRLPVIATLEELDEDALINILTEPKNALVKQYQALFGIENVGLEFEEGALRSIARQAMERKTGARGLRSIVERCLLDTMYRLPDLQGLKKWWSARQSSKRAGTGIGVRVLMANKTASERWITFPKRFLFLMPSERLPVFRRHLLSA